MAPKIAQPYLKIPIGNSISGGIAPNRFVRNGSRFLKWGELVLAANGSISRVPIVSSWRRIKAIFGTIALVEAKNQSYINSISSFLSRFRIYRPFRHSTNFQVNLFFFLRSVASDFFFLGIFACGLEENRLFPRK
ncbi:hypothetical protein RHGRI_003815 [Rhododendron griersonianum]|uniref:Uncharacterized protein n=1 Tax=Rhododendron griersonianum TaxID=479676 RepID=A0AAV6L6M6_9ERIC|nr:hypothetical protein RHGRI_003815 [Rhododendron griersonianum]